MFTLIKKLFPNLMPLLHILIGFIYDFIKFAKSSSSIKTYENKNKLQSLITRQYHGIEKGLSLPNTRLGFGSTLIKRLIKNVYVYTENYGYDALVGVALDNLVEYIEYHKNKHYELDPIIQKDIHNLLNNITEYKEQENKKGGVKILEKNDLLHNIRKCDFKAFSDSRSSIRDFADGDVPINLIKEAVSIASNSPSVCNRQAWKVNIYKDEAKDKILNHQYGNKGFRGNIDTVLLVTGISNSYSYIERNQMFIDGGIFSMALIYALHGMEVGVCALNTAYTVKQEIKFRKAINLEIKYEPIMMLAVGLIKERFTVTKSTNKDISELMVIKHK